MQLTVSVVVIHVEPATATNFPATTLRGTKMSIGVVMALIVVATLQIDSSTSIVKGVDSYVIAIFSLLSHFRQKVASAKILDVSS